MPYTKLKRVNSQILKNIIILQQSYDFNGLEVLMGGNVGSNTQDEDGKTLLMYKYILHCNRPNAKQFLNYFQPDITLQDHTGRTAADYARENGNHEDALFLYTKEIEASKLSPSKKQELKYRLYESYSKYGDIHKIKNLKNILQQFRGVPEDNFKVKTQANYEEIIERQQKQLAEALKGNGNTQILQNLAKSGCDFSKINLNSDSYRHLSRENKKIIRQRQQEQLQEALQESGNTQILQNLVESEFDFSRVNLNLYSYKSLSKNNRQIVQRGKQKQLKKALQGNGDKEKLQILAHFGCDFSRINLNSDLYQHLSEDNKKIVHERQQKQLEEALQGNGDTQIIQNLAKSGCDFSRINLKSDSYVHLSEDNKEIIRQRQQEQLKEALQKSGNAYILQNLSNSGCDFSGINLNSDLYVHLSKDNKDIVQKRQEKQLEEALRGNGDKQILQNLANAEYDFSKINLNSTSCKYLSEDNKKIIQQKQQAQSKEKSKSQKNVQITQNVSGIVNDLSKINLNSDLYKNVPEYIKKNIQERQYEQLQEALQGSGDKQILQNLANAEYDFSKINLKSDSYVHLSEDNKEIIRKRQEKQLIKALQKPENIPILQNLADSEVNFGIISLYLRTDLSSTAKQIIQERQEKQAMEREQNTQQASMQPIWRRNLGVCGTSSANQSQNTHLGQNHAIPGAQQPPAVRGAGNQGNQRGNGNNIGG